MGIVPVCMASGMQNPQPTAQRVHHPGTHLIGHEASGMCGHVVKHVESGVHGGAGWVIYQCLWVVMVVTIHGVQCVWVGVWCVKSRPSVYPWRTLVV